MSAIEWTDQTWKRMYVIAASAHPEDQRATPYTFAKAFRTKAEAIDHFVDCVPSWDIFADQDDDERTCADVIRCQTEARRGLSSADMAYWLDVEGEILEVFTLNEVEV